MRTASSVAAITSSSVPAATCAYVGLTTSLPSVMVTRTAPMGPAKGMPERQSAAEEPIMASTSGSFSLSAEITRLITCISLRKPFGNSGRMGRSIRRQVSVSFSSGRPSRLKKPPGIFPPA
jgi:hypothetical protein